MVVVLRGVFQLEAKRVDGRGTAGLFCNGLVRGGHCLWDEETYQLERLVLKPRLIDQVRTDRENGDADRRRQAELEDIDKARYLPEIGFIEYHRFDPEAGGAGVRGLKGCQHCSKKAGMSRNGNECRQSQAIDASLMRGSQLQPGRAKCSQ